MSADDFDAVCTCGDVHEEHEWSGSRYDGHCLVDGCPCIHFEADEPADPCSTETER